MNRDEMTQQMRDGCTIPQVHKINDYIDNLENQLKQQDEVIDEVSKLLEYYYIGNLKYDKESQRAFERIFDLLNKYKRGNNG